MKNQEKRRPGAPVSGCRRGIGQSLEAGWRLRDDVLPTMSNAHKILDILEGKRGITPPMVLPPVKEKALEQLEIHPLAQNQARYLDTNLRRFKPKKKRAEILNLNSNLFSRIIRDLPHEKQKALLQTLSKISKSLEFDGLLLHEDDAGVVSSPVLKSKKILEPLSANASIISLTKDEVSSLHSNSIHSSARASSTDESHIGTISLTGSYSSNKSYGQAKIDALHAEATNILDRIGRGMHDHVAETQYNYDLTGRGKVELVPPTALIARIYADFKVSLSTADVAIIMRKFDVQQRGVVDIADVLGHAKNVFSKTQHLDTMDELAREAEIQRKLLLEKRAEHRAKIGGKDIDGTEIEGTMKRDAMKNIIDKLSAAAYDAIRTKSLRCLNTARSKLSPQEFRAILMELSCGLSSREAFLLERRYIQGQTGTVDVAVFRAEFIALGKDMIRDSRRADAMDSFLRALSRGNGDTRGKAGIESITPVHAADAPQSQPKIEIQAQNIPVVKSRMTIEMTQEWLEDPLVTPRRVRKSPQKSSEKAAAKELVVESLPTEPSAPVLEDIALKGSADRSDGLVSRIRSRQSSRGSAGQQEDQQATSRPVSVSFREQVDFAPIPRSEDNQDQVDALDAPALESITFPDAAPPVSPMPTSDISRSCESELFEENMSGMSLPYILSPALSTVSDSAAPRVRSSNGDRGKTVQFTTDDDSTTVQSPKVEIILISSTEPVDPTRFKKSRLQYPYNSR